jgi:hypothetical protein
MGVLYLASYASIITKNISQFVLVTDVTHNAILNNENFGYLFLDYCPLLK